MLRKNSRKKNENHEGEQVIELPEQDDQVVDQQDDHQAQEMVHEARETQWERRQRVEGQDHQARPAPRDRLFVRAREENLHQDYQETTLQKDQLKKMK